MKKLLPILLILTIAAPAKAWWDPGHLITAMIAYLQLDEQAKARVDELTTVLERDYPYVNHFIATGPWPDDLKAEGVRAYNTWHYTNIPYNWQGVALPPKQNVDVIWAINEAQSILRTDRSRDIDKARFLAFLVHFVSDLHQPLHSTSVHDDDQPSGNAGGNGFALTDSPWRNLHALWDAAAGYLDDYNDINPYGQPKDGLTEAEIERLRGEAVKLMQQYPESNFPSVDVLDPDFWALESHKLALRYGYRAVNGQDDRGRRVYLESGGTPSELYLENVREISRQRLVLSGYRLGRMLNELFGGPGEEKSIAEEKAVMDAVNRILQAINTRNPAIAEPALMEDAVFYSIRERHGEKITGEQTAKQFLRSVGKGSDRHLERIWNPRVQIEDDVATVSAPYDFHVNGAFSHCGTDIFNLIKTQEGWQVSALTYDVITEGCLPSPLGEVGKEK